MSIQYRQMAQSIHVGQAYLEHEQGASSAGLYSPPLPVSSIQSVSCKLSQEVSGQ